jgi:SAM-dependent methyltransferase
MTVNVAKEHVRDFWQTAACGEEAYAVGDSPRSRLETQACTRYQLEPYIRDFARFEDGRGKDVLEVGVGMGADHLEWAKAQPRSLIGIDLTSKAVEYTRERLKLFGFDPKVEVADAERLPFPDRSFDIVYSWGVLHHTPDTAKAFAEVHRVLRPGGLVRAMIYHSHSLVGYMLWVRYALMQGRPRRPLSDIYAHHLESPGTQAFSRREVRDLLSGFVDVRTRVQLSFGDLLEGGVGQRHKGPLLSVAKRAYPRRLIRRVGQSQGLYLLLEAHA